MSEYPNGREYLSSLHTRGHDIEAVYCGPCAKERFKALESQLAQAKAELDSHINTTADLQLSLRRVCEDRDAWKFKAEKLAEVISNLEYYDEASVLKAKEALAFHEEK